MFFLIYLIRLGPATKENLGEIGAAGILCCFELPAEILWGAILAMKIFGHG